MGWNGSGRGSTPQKPKVAAKKPSPIRGLIAGGAVVALAVVAYFVFFSGTDKPQEEKTDKGRGRIKAVTPAVAQTNAAPVVKKPVDPREDYDHTKMYRDEKGVLRWNTGCRAFDPTRPRMKPRELGTGNKRYFRHDSESEIAAFLDSTPGERRLATPDYSDPAFLEDFQRALKDPTLIKEDDPEDVKSLKKAVEEIKADLAKRIAKGEKLADIFSETSREMDRLAQYKDDLEKELGRVIKDGEGKFTDDDVLDAVGAANKMLEENGINPVMPDEFVKWNVRLAAEKLGASREETEAAEWAAIDRLEKKEKEAEAKKEEEVK